MSIGSLSGTLTRQYQIRDIVVALGQVPQQASLTDIQAALDQAHTAHAGLAARLFDVDSSGRTVHSELHGACRDGRSDARVLVWAALLIADQRLAHVVEQFLTSRDGTLRHERFNAAAVRAELERRRIGSAQKAASNLLRYFETAGIVEGLRQGSTIVGVDRVLSTGHAVPGVVTLALERASYLEGTTVPVGEAVEFAVDRGLNRWLLLTADQFCAAASAATVAPTSASTTGTPAGSPPSPPPQPASTSRWEGFKPKDDSEYEALVAAQTLRKSRTHESIVNAYAKWAEGQMFRVSSPHPVDLSLQRSNERWIVEVKVISNGDATAAVRQAVGQLLEYRYFLYGSDTRLVALFSEEVGSAYVRYLATLGIAAVWMSGNGWQGSPGAVADGLSSN